MRRLFGLLDRDGSGELTKKEIMTALRKNAEVQKIIKGSPTLKALGKPRTIATAFQEMDLDGSGSVTYDEFLSIVKVAQNAEI